MRQHSRGGKHDCLPFVRFRINHTFKTFRWNVLNKAIISMFAGFAQLRYLFRHSGKRKIYPFYIIRQENRHGITFRKKEPNTFKELIKEKNKQDKKIEKQWEDRMNTKYTAENLRAAKKMMVSNAMEIDKLEYEKIAKELKEKLNK